MEQYQLMSCETRVLAKSCSLGVSGMMGVPGLCHVNLMGTRTIT